MKKIELGSKVEDSLTGFSGVVIGIVTYLTGCDQYLVLPRAKDTHTLPSGEWLDSNRCVLLKDTTVTLDTAKEKGACKMAPIK